MFKNELTRKVSSKRIYIWNAVANLCNAASTVLFMLIITRILGTVQGGIFSVAFALSQQMLTVANFETATYQITESKNSFTFGTYLFSRTLLYVLSILVGFLVAFFSSYSLYKTVAVVLLCMYKGLDAFNATFSALMQRKGRLDIGCKALAIRIIVSVIIFAFSAVIFKDLLVSIALMLAFSIIWMFLYEIKYTSYFEKIKFDYAFSKTLKLILECFPMFLGSFLLIYICNSPKYVLDSVMRDETVNTVFGVIFMPSSIISLLSIFIYRPVLTELTRFWANGEIKRFISKILSLALFIFGASAFCIGVAYLCGTQILGTIYGLDLSEYKFTLCVCLLGGTMYALASLVYNAIVILRRQRIMIFCYLAASTVSLLVSPILVDKFSLLGAVIAYLISCSVLCILISVLFAVLVAKHKKA